jgi:CRP-like cAMP-binding protein
MFRNQLVDTAKLPILYTQQLRDQTWKTASTLIYRNSFLRQLSASDAAAFGQTMSEVSLGQGERICAEGRPYDHLYFPGTAVTSVVTVMLSGQAVESCTIGFESAPGILSVLGNLPSTARVFTQIPGSAIRIPAAEVRRRAMESPAFLMQLIKFAQINASQAELSVACNAIHDVRQRLARWLLLTRDRVGHDSIQLTQEFLAIMLGVQRTTVSTAANDLKKNGLIDYRRGRIELLDRKGMLDLVCECYGVGNTLQEVIAGS